MKKRISSLRIAAKVLHQIECHTAVGAPLEICGLLAGKENSVEVAYPITNTASDPAHSFYMQPQELYDGLMTISRHQLDLLAVYHSHPPDVPPYPSPDDAVGIQGYPQAGLVILSVGVNSILARAFFPVGGTLIETELIPF